MDIRNTRELKNFAAQRLQGHPTAKQLAFLCAAVIIGTAFLNTGLNYLLNVQIEGTGGLSNIGKRSLLATFQTFFPYIRMALVMCVELGYTSAMLRIARGQYVSPQTLRLGFDRFWVLLRCTIIKGLLYTSGIFLSVYAGISLYLMTPLAEPVIEFLVPYLDGVSVLDSAVVLEDAVYSQFAAMLWPAYLICGLLAAVLLFPMVYSYRMAEFVIIDKPAFGALMAMRESKKMMRRNRISLFKLDVSMWWYYAALTLASVLGYGDAIMPLLGVELPFSADAGYFLFYALYLAASAGVYYLMLDRVDVTYALAYDTLKPEEPKNEGAVLGNIFQM